MRDGTVHRPRIDAVRGCPRARRWSRRPVGTVVPTSGGPPVTSAERPRSLYHSALAVTLDSVGVTPVDDGARPWNVADADRGGPCAKGPAGSFGGWVGRHVPCPATTVRCWAARRVRSPPGRRRSRPVSPRRGRAGRGSHGARSRGAAGAGRRTTCSRSRHDEPRRLQTEGRRRAAHRRRLLEAPTRHVVAWVSGAGRRPRTWHAPSRPDHSGRPRHRARTVPALRASARRQAASRRAAGLTRAERRDRDCRTAGTPRLGRGSPAAPHAPAVRAAWPALSSTTRRICSISSKCSWSQISGGESWTTGSPRSSARQ